MKRVVPLIIGSYLCLLVSCTLPEWRVFQKKVDPKMGETPVQQVESQKQAAKYLEYRIYQLLNSSDLPIYIRKDVQDIYKVASLLTKSLGEPNKPIVDQTQAIAALESGIRAEQRKTEEWKAFAKKYAGKTIEGTGVDLFEPSALLGVAGFVALCVFVPGFLTVVLFFFRRLRLAGQQMIEGIEQYKKDNPEQVAKLEATLRGPMDRASKNVVKKLKKLLPNETPSPAA